MVIIGFHSSYYSPSQIFKEINSNEFEKKNVINNIGLLSNINPSGVNRQSLLKNKYSNEHKYSDLFVEILGSNIFPHDFTNILVFFLKNANADAYHSYLDFGYFDSVIHERI